MARTYDASGKILTGDNFPQITFMNKEGKPVIFVVDNRQSTYKQIQKLSNEMTTAPKADVDYEREILLLALNKEQMKEIDKMDLSVKATKELSLFVMAAIQEEDYEKIKEAVEKNQ